MNVAYIEGDSTTFGWVDLEKGGWANRLHVASLHNEGGLDDLTIVKSHAMPGRTLPRILQEAEDNMKSYRGIGETAAILQTGTNEVKSYPPSTVPIVSAKRFGELITRFCDIAERNDCTPILVGAPPIDTTGNKPAYGGAVIPDELLAEYGGIMRSVAYSRGIPYVDARALFENSGRPVQELICEDGYHPSTLGHAMLATAVQQVLPFQLDGSF